MKKGGYEFDEYNVSESKENADMLLRLGARVTPVIMIGDQMIMGFSPNKLSQVLEQES